MTPRQYEMYAAQTFTEKGYEVVLTPQSNDYGVDFFATKGEEKIAVQVKMYGDSREINRKAVMELYGAKAFFDCTAAKIITDGVIRKDAVKVAEKLKIEVLYLTPDEAFITEIINMEVPENDFFEVWKSHIIPLAGTTLYNSQGNSNKLTKIDYTGVERLTGNDKPGRIPIEIFKEAYNRILEKGEITRNEINQEFTGRASSGVVLILSQIPFIELQTNPIKLILKKNDR